METLFQAVRKTSQSKYIFKIEPVLTEIQRVHMAIYRTDADNRRQDNAKFFMEFRKFRALLSLAKQIYAAKHIFTLPVFFGGERGERKLTVSFERGDIQKKKVYGMAITIADSGEKDDKAGKKGYGRMFISDRFEIEQFFDMYNTMNNFELANINRLLKDAESAPNDN